MSEGSVFGEAELEVLLFSRSEPRPGARGFGVVGEHEEDHCGETDCEDAFNKVDPGSD